jgi:ribonuclease P/MRP protein subunit RPP1
MKRTFADLHLRTNSNFQQMFAKAAELGYTLVATTFPPQAKPEEIRQAKAACGELGLDFVSRVDLNPRNQNDLLDLLRRLRRRFEVLCVSCESKDVARQAAKDHRVDLLSFPFLDARHRFFDRAEAELASCGNAGFEVDMKPLLVLDGPTRVRFLSSLLREVAVALEFHLPVVVSSGVSEPILLRKPREMAALAGLFGLAGDVALDAVSTNPAGLVMRNRGKLEAGFVAPGIRVVKQGEDQ